MAGNKRRLSSEINVVPYIDVMLVLLIIFMVTAPMMVQGIQVDLPETTAQSMNSDAEEVVMSVNQKGELFLSVGDDQGEPLTDDDFVEKVSAIVRNKPEQMILVQGDSAVPYQFVANGMSLLQEAGARKIGFVTQPREDGPAR
ncbi:protein TolR [Sinimarinibacterium sp. NLF-5-8]|uniref:protein TolR n=1 Tax=Sinimarinibacterium sp. NLF-5-8 TaxID=2698684 RepID=UPI00137C180F|nr:protein TolR [Sinimarinibacterium sp. NLF-5-8]QHS08748.1 protein TolR [Sinimarinibacterium sp. NLF-5-8]